MIKRKLAGAFLGLVLCFSGFSQSEASLTLLKAQKDSMLKAAYQEDSLKIEKQFQQKEKWEKLKARTVHPVFNSGDFSGVIPVENPTEIPDPNMDYKLLFELTFKNPDSLAAELNFGLVEVTRIINLHAQAGIPIKRIMPVIVVHAGALNAFTTNTYYQEHFHKDNPNLDLISQLEKFGTKFIACGQAMAFLNFKKEDMLPLVRISLTAQTVLSSYQLKGYVLYNLTMKDD
ncbi:MAG: hypothetical protein GC171_02935 [Terrimonas sp.]|nr:hypothetical protein [Terrimonas sp.]